MLALGKKTLGLAIPQRLRRAFVRVLDAVANGPDRVGSVAMSRRRVRSMAKELETTFHQTAMSEAGELMDLAYELADSDLDDEAATSRVRAAFPLQNDGDRAVAYP